MDTVINAIGRPLNTSSPGENGLNTSTWACTGKLGSARANSAEGISCLELAFREPREAGDRCGRAEGAFDLLVEEGAFQYPGGRRRGPALHMASEERELRRGPLRRMVLQLPVTELSTAPEANRTRSNPAHR